VIPRRPAQWLVVTDAPSYTDPSPVTLVVFGPSHIATNSGASRVHLFHLPHFGCGREAQQRYVRYVMYLLGVMLLFGSFSPSLDKLMQVIDTRLTASEANIP
jgi:hypothetical protein